MYLRHGNCHRHHLPRQLQGAGEAIFTMTVQPVDSADLPVKLAELGLPLLLLFRSQGASEVPKTNMAGSLRVGDLLIAARSAAGQTSRIRRGAASALKGKTTVGEGGNSVLALLIARGGSARAT